MKLQDQVTNLELSKKLKELGVKQESQFYWHRPIDGNGKPNGKYFVNWKEANDFCDDDSHDHKPVSAFTVAELGELLPQNFTNEDGAECTWSSYLSINGWNVQYQDLDENFLYEERDRYEAIARGKLLVYLLEEKLI